MTPHEFIAKWKPAELKERAACQAHFLDLCRLLGQKDPIEADPKGTWYTFEYGVQKDVGGRDFAVVWKKNHLEACPGKASASKGESPNHNASLEIA